MVRSLLAASLLFLAGTALPAAPEAPPAEIRIASAVGEVLFRHQAHFEERSIPCASCHHQINARKLETPHPEYLKSASINCQVCHDESGSTKQVYDCKQCHRTTPLNVADETLSAKVVVHKQCWTCHAETPKEAAASCASCHSKKKSP